MKRLLSKPLRASQWTLQAFESVRSAKLRAPLREDSPDTSLKIGTTGRRLARKRQSFPFGRRSVEYGRDPLLDFCRERLERQRATLPEKSHIWNDHGNPCRLARRDRRSADQCAEDALGVIPADPYAGQADPPGKKMARKPWLNSEHVLLRPDRPEAKLQCKDARPRQPLESRDRRHRGPFPARHASYRDVPLRCQSRKPPRQTGCRELVCLTNLTFFARLLPTR